MADPMSKPSTPTDPRDDPSRPSTASNLIYSLGRFADGPLQYFLFTRGTTATIASSLGLRTSQALVQSGPGILPGLGPIPSLLTTMYTVAALRHVYWMQYSSTYNFPTAASVVVIIYNFLLNFINSVVAVNTLPAPSSPSVLAPSFIYSLEAPQWAGIALFVTGVGIELASEESRRRFKSKSVNKGKIDNTGLFSAVRHPNYLGYALWRTGMTLVTGSWKAAVVSFGWQVFMFASTGIPSLVGHMEAKYGKQWEEYQKNVPYKLIPYVW